jgi:hypothetical protein
MFHIKFPDMFMIYVHIQFNLSRSSGSAIIFIKPQLNTQSVMFHNLRKYYLKKKFNIFQKSITIQHFNESLLAVDVSVAPTSEVCMAAMLVLLMTGY